MSDITLDTSRLRVLNEIFSAQNDPDSRVAAFVDRFGGSGGWLNPDIDWNQQGRRNQLHDLLLQETEDRAHLDGMPTRRGEHTGIIRMLGDKGKFVVSMETVGSGVRVAKRIVLTAKHVVRSAQASQAQFTDPENRPTFSFSKEDVVEADDCDVAAIVFPALPESLEIVPIADSGEIKKGGTYRSIGFGLTQRVLMPQAFKNHLDGMIIFSSDCQGDDDPEKYSCKPGKEIVAGATKGKAYHHDSGGGLLVKSADNVWKLAGVIGGNSATKIANAARYTRVDAVRDEINGKLQNAGHPSF